MNLARILFDIFLIAAGVALFAWGHYTGWYDYHRKLRGSDRPPAWSSQNGLPRNSVLLALAVALVIIGLLLRWAGVLS